MKTIGRAIEEEKTGGAAMVMCADNRSALKHYKSWDILFCGVAFNFSMAWLNAFPSTRQIKVFPFRRPDSRQIDKNTKPRSRFENRGSIRRFMASPSGNVGNMDVNLITL
jgi:hypothetical protein